MKNYNAIIKRLHSHPSYALTLVRRMNRTKVSQCKRCHCSGGLEIHHTDKRGIKTYHCKKCKKNYSELFGSIFYRSKVPIHKWLICIMEWSISTGSISAAELQRRLGVNYNTAWNMLMKMRSMMINVLPDQLMDGITEIDEAWMGKKDNQDIVFGIVERTHKKLQFVLIPNTKEKTIRKVVLKHVKKRSVLNTDGAMYYGFASVNYEQNSVIHSQKEFARAGGIHTNTMEQIWGDFKGIIRTIHHGVSKTYRLLYLAQYAFRYNIKFKADLFFATLFSCCSLKFPNVI
jgi:transposase-like protein